MTNWSVEPSSSTLPQLTSVTSSPLTPITQMQQVRLKSVLKSILMPLKTDIISDSLLRSCSSNSLRVRFQGVKDHYSIVCISVSLRSPLYVSRYLCQRLTRLMWLRHRISESIISRNPFEIVLCWSLALALQSFLVDFQLKELEYKHLNRAN